MKKSAKRIPIKKPEGFALIATISVMVLLVMIALAMLSLSTVELRSSAQGAPMEQARANARLALLLAIGELQKTAGSDKRITANASIDDSNSAQPNILGVWHSFGQDNAVNETIDYDEIKTNLVTDSESDEGGFIQWLVSGRPADQLDIDYPTGQVPNEVELVNEGTTSAGSSNYLSASTIDVTGSDPNITGKYAWAVMDEAQKIQLTLNNPSLESDADKIASLTTPGKPGFSVDSNYDIINDLNDDEIDKLLSLNSSEILNFETLENNAFNFLTTNSKSLLVDVVNGGFQKDLSLLFNDDTLPSEYAERYIYSDKDDNTPAVDTPVRFNDAEPIRNPDPQWALLHSHYKLYKDVEEEEGAYGVQTSTTRREDDTGFFENQQLFPVISNAQFIFSLSPEKINNNNGEQYTVGLWIDVALTVWNPYNVNLTVNGLEVDMYRFPLELQYFRDGVNLTNNQYVHFADTYAAEGTNNANGNIERLPFRMRIPNTFTLAPGEYRVFGAPTDNTFPWRGLHFTQGLELEEGFVIQDENNDRGEGLFTRVLTGGHTPASFIRIQNPTNEGIGDQTVSVSVQAATEKRDISIIETNGEEISTYLKIYTGSGSTSLGQVTTATAADNALEQLDAERVHIGSVEIDIPANEIQDYLPTIPQDDLADLVIESGVAILDTEGYDLPGIKANQGNSDGKQPFLITSIRLKTEQDVNPNVDNSSSIWIHNGVTNPYFSNGISDDQDVDLKNLAYDITWEPFTALSSSSVQIEENNNHGYGGLGLTPESGVTHAPFLQIPLTPATSIAQLSHAPINSGGLAPHTTQVIGNSFATLSIPLDLKSQDVGGGTFDATMVDPSYMANTTLFDGYFLSTITDGAGPVSNTSSRTIQETLDDFAEGNDSLTNSNFEVADPNITDITTDDYAEVAQYLYNKGAFNVNSTSEEAWELFLASGSQESLLIMDALTANSSFNESSSDGYAFSRFSLLLGNEITPSENEEGSSSMRWRGHRRLTEDQISTLAGNIVTEVKKRGPFQSIAEFVNRRLTSDASTGSAGAIQTAIDNSNINVNIGEPAPRNMNELSGNGSGFTSDGSPTQITQADILNRLAPSITVRGDTFTVRAYGEATVNNQTARIWCEAVLQRTHDFVDPSDEATTEYSELNEINTRLGREFEMISFKWLTKSEI